jgi:amidase
MDTHVTDQDLEQALSQLGMTTDTPELYRAIIEANLEVTALVDAVDPPVTGTGSASRDWHRPEPADNRLGAWYVKTDIQGAGQGKLAGKIRYCWRAYP